MVLFFQMNEFFIIIIVFQIKKNITLPSVIEKGGRKQKKETSTSTRAARGTSLKPDGMEKLQQSTENEKVFQYF